MGADDETRRGFAELVDTSDKAEALYQGLFVHNRAIMLIIDPESGDIRDANAAACHYYGYSRDAMRKMQIMAINTLSQEQVRAEMDDAKQEKRQFFNFRHRLADGRIRDVEVFSGPILINNEMLLYSIIHDISDRKRIEQEKELLIEELMRAIKEIKILQGILPICSSCKKIRDDKGYWQQLEAYISVYSEAEFSHGICPDCAARLYPDLILPQKNKKKT
ncbi:MAG: PAS domain S-box protein [Proteobacteria bacterium]|nr:PAS domain S-box protein [Pseudomonadota bacterium]